MLLSDSDRSQSIVDLRPTKTLLDMILLTQSNHIFQARIVALNPLILTLDYCEIWRSRWRSILRSGGPVGKGQVAKATGYFQEALWASKNPTTSAFQKTSPYSPTTSYNFISAVTARNRRKVGTYRSLMRICDTVASASAFESSS